MKTLLIISFLLAASFTGVAIWRKKELPDSISSLVYTLPKGAWQWAWTIWLWVVTVTLAPPLVESLPEPWKFLGFLTVVCLCVCGATPVFMKDKKGVHDFFGIAAGFMSQLCVLFICPWMLLVWLLMVLLVAGAFFSFNESGGTAKAMDGKGVFIAEAICAVTLYGALFTA